MEWLEDKKADKDLKKVIDLFCLEQFYKAIPDFMRDWMQDKQGEMPLEQAATLADEFVNRKDGIREEQTVSKKKRL